MGYHETHIPMLLKFKGITGVTTYEITEAKGEYPEFLVIYEFENRQASAAYETSPELAAAREDALQTFHKVGYEVKWRVDYECIRSWQR
jgi:antibiotic biosynthesis monooxygenase (ABM) superfamily enzyme